MPFTSRPLSFVPKDTSPPQGRDNEAEHETESSVNSDSIFCVGLRVVRGPDWESKNGGGDGGDGFVGTVVEVGSDSSRLAKNMAMVQWDRGIREAYKAGYQGKYEISILDNSTVGVKHRGVVCCACKQSPVVGMYWKCLDCKVTSVHLCTSCYMSDEHDQAHAFLRFDGSSENGTPVARRITATKIEARGIYPDAIVTRSAGWEHNEQDGGVFGTVTEITSWKGIPACAATVEWVSGTEGTYRLGYQGKVDLQCITASSGGRFYKSHLPTLGPSPQHAGDENQPSEENDKPLEISEENVESTRSECVGLDNKESNETSDEPVIAKPSDDTEVEEVPDEKSHGQSLTAWERRGKEAKSSRSTLHNAAINGQWEAVKVLLDNGEDVDREDKFSLTPLHLAAWYGQESIVKLLLECGAKVNATDRFQKTPLQKAERHNHQSIVQILKKHGASPSYQQPLSLRSLCKFAVLAVDQRSGFSLLHAAILEGHYGTVVTTGIFVNDVLREMTHVSTGKHAKSFASKTGYEILTQLDRRVTSKIKAFLDREVEKAGTLTELHRCGDNDDAELAVELVLRHGIDVNSVAKGGRTPFLWVSARCSSVFAKTLIDLGADTNAQREDKCTSLILATHWNNYMTTRLLTQTGIDTNILADKSNSALHISAMKGLVNIALFLIEAGCNVNLQNSSGKTSLHLAVRHKHGHLVKILLENNADVNIRDTYDPKEHLYLVRGRKKGEPVWNYVEVKKALSGLLDKRVATNRVHLASFGSVLASGSGNDPPDGTRKEVRAKVDAQVTKETKDKTALHFACGVNGVEVIAMLIKHGADCNARDANGFTPLHMAAISGNMEAVQKLVEHNVDVNLTTADGKDAAHYAQLNEEWEIEQYLKSKRSPFRKLWNKLSKKR